MVTKHKSASHDAMVLRSMVLAPLDFMEKTSAKPLFFGEKKMHMEYPMNIPKHIPLYAHSGWGSEFKWIYLRP